MCFSGQLPLELGPTDPNMSERENIRSLSLKFIQQRSYYNSQFYYTTTPGQLRLGNKEMVFRKAILLSSLL